MPERSAAERVHDERRADFEELADRAARKAVKAVLGTLGLHIDEDGEARHIRADFSWVREARKAEEKRRDKIRDQLTGAGVTLLLSAVAAGAVAMLNRGHW